MTPSVEAIHAALGRIIDPCSISAGVPLGLTDMGLVEEVTAGVDGAVTIRLRLTSLGCLMGVLIFEPEITDRVGKIPGVTSVSVQFGDPVTWSEAAISEDGRRRLGEVRRRGSERAMMRTSFPVS